LWIVISHGGKFGGTFRRVGRAFAIKIGARIGRRFGRFASGKRREWFMRRIRTSGIRGGGSTKHERE
jgi:hypothetical protein